MNKKIVQPLAALVLLSVLFACKGNEKKDDEATNEQTTSVETTVSTLANAPLTFNVTYAPDSAILGKSKEAFVKFTGGEAVVLQDPDGKSAGSEVTFNFRITNKSTLDNQKFFALSSSDARLELDNGSSITIDSQTGDTNPEAEATSEASWTFQVPVGAKPVKLNLFLDGTRVSVGVNLEEKK